MRATMAQLEAFYWIARLGSFHAAARQLHVTQPTISARIAELEQTLGAPLFDRANQRARLTSRGSGIVPSVDRMLKLSDDIALHSQSGSTLRGLLRLGAVESVALMTLPHLLPRFVARYPELKVELTLDVGSALNRKLNASELDVAVLTDPQVNDGVTVEAVGNIELAWFASARLKLPRRHPLRPADLRLLPILTMPNPSTIHRAISQWFSAASVEPEHISSCNSLALMVRLIAAGQGIAVLPTAMVRAEVASGQLVRLPTSSNIQPGVLVVAFVGPAHRYRPLVKTISDALRESELVAHL
ncbi:MAG: LysR family transcriptional regulator [Variovorax sp.]